MKKYNGPPWFYTKWNRTDKFKWYIVGCQGVAQQGSSGLFHVGATKVKACGSFLFTDGPIKTKNKEHFSDLVVTL